MSYTHEGFFRLWPSWSAYKNAPDAYVDLSPTSCTVDSQRHGGITSMSMTIPARWRHYGGIQRGSIIRVGGSTGENRFGVFIVTSRSSKNGDVQVSGIPYALMRIRHRYPEGSIGSEDVGDNLKTAILSLNRLCYFPDEGYHSVSIHGQTILTPLFIFPICDDVIEFADSDDSNKILVEETTQSYGRVKERRTSTSRLVHDGRRTLLL